MAEFDVDAMLERYRGPGRGRCESAVSRRWRGRDGGPSSSRRNATTPITPWWVARPWSVEGDHLVLRIPLGG